MTDTFSPKQAARAIGVSESSLKRWCDQGLIRTERTAGGHRRLTKEAVISFLRENDRTIVDPQQLGLPATTGQSKWTLDRAAARLRDALLEGEFVLCRQIIMDLYLADHAVTVICDDVVTQAMHSIGDQWTRGEAEVFEERRAVEICTRIVHELRSLKPPVGPDAPAAAGGTLDGDPYTLACGMAEMVLSHAGWNAAPLGNRLPFNTLQKAIVKMKPRLLWLSVSAIRDPQQFADQFNNLFDSATAVGTALVLGGRALDDNTRSRLRYSAYCDTYAHLHAFSATLLQSVQAKSS